MRAAKARRGWIGCAAASLALGVALGCGSYTIPRHALEGTTLVIAVPASFKPGFGRRRSDAMTNRTAPITSLPAPAYVPGHPHEDEIRGELVFSLLKRSNGQFVSYLPVRYVTRVHLDEGSPGGLDDPSVATWGVAEYAKGQVLAFVDVPLGVVAANGGNHDFAINVWSSARKPAQPSVWETLLVTIDGVWWLGWGEAQPYLGIPIDIYAGDGSTHFNDDYLGWEGNSGYYAEDVTEELEDVVPRPKALMRVIIPATAEYPAAWEADITLPRQKGQVIGVEAASHHKSSAVAMIINPATPDTGCVSGNRTVRVAMADPRKRTEGVRLIVKPPDFSCSNAQRLSANNHFTISSVVAYDETGTEIDENDVDAYFTGGIR